MVICLERERDADLHMAQLMPLPLTVCCFSKIKIGSASAATNFLITIAKNSEQCSANASV